MKKKAPRGDGMHVLPYFFSTAQKPKQREGQVDAKGEFGC